MIVAIDPDIPLLTGRKPEMGLQPRSKKPTNMRINVIICGVQSLRTERVITREKKEITINMGEARALRAISS